MIAGLMLLSSCAGSENNAEKSALDMKTEFNEAARIEIVADVKADYGDRVYEFKLKYTGGGETGEIAIMEPETIAGLSAAVSLQGGVTLKYDGAELDTGAVTADGLSPAEALPTLIEQWRTGFITYCDFEKLGDADTFAAVSDISNATRQKTWFDAKTLLPVRSEISNNGTTVIFCQFENVVLD